MKVFTNIHDFSSHLATVVSVGTFDGLHKGHQAIINRLITIAGEKNLASVIVTFDPHPRYALHKDNEKLKLLSTTEEKIEQLASYGVDYACIINFTKEFSRIAYEDFIKYYLVDALGANHIVIGFDHRFGENRSGDHQTLLALKDKYGFEVVEIKALYENNIEISSTKIRNLIQEGSIEQANGLLGYDYNITGTVVSGIKKGRKLGYPTVNLQVAGAGKLVPAQGVYFVRVEIDGKYYYGMCNIGVKPTFGKQEQTIETHIFDFDRDIYGKKIKISFHSFIRQEQKFENIGLLKTQLDRDKALILKMINEQRH
ncbi:MAG TPA: bifunctional riboflavin kinase/FAD synthetase [Bacteroidales bacterium]|nr:bifunctional riboflavin kinase/FAD synthetase [Bacteroidales bacterium]